MKKIKTVILGLLSLLIVIAPQVADLIPEKWEVEIWTAIVFYEAFIRWVPTAKSWSILTNAFNLLKLLAPDKATKAKTLNTKTHA